MDPHLVILGAGCSGTSLALSLRRQGFSGQLTLIDERTTFDREQRWCFWDEPPHPDLNRLVRHRWNAWTVGHDSFNTYRRDASSSYQEIYAPDFFEQSHAQLLAYPNTRLAFGLSVRSISESASVVTIETEYETFQADKLIDARNLPPFKQEKRSSYHKGMGQTFLGTHIKVKPKSFDPSNFTWMDFRLPQPNGLWFGYILPYSDSEALVEVAALSTIRPSIKLLEQQLLAYQKNLQLEPVQVLAQEVGYIPMQSDHFPVKLSSRRFQTGILAGCARPSSGYAFLRIQSQAEALAAHLIKGTPLPTWKLKHTLLDRVFLRVLDKHPRPMGLALARLLAKTPSTALIAFFNEKSSLFQDLQIIARLPKCLFLKAAFSCLLHRSPHQLSPASKNHALETHPVLPHA